MQRPEESKRARGRGGRIGRSLGIALVGSLFVYMSVVGLHSVTRQIFAPPATPWPTGTTCENGLGTLRARLADEAARQTRALVLTAADDPAMMRDLRAFLRGWDRDHAGLAPLCREESLSEAHRVLSIFRFRLAQDLERMDRDDRPLLRSLAARATPPPPHDGRPTP